MATACAVAALQAGASWVHGTIDGIGERAGNANLPEIALALELLYGASTGMRFDRVRAASERPAPDRGLPARTLEERGRRKPVRARDRRRGGAVPHP
jgi:isopropylmalate/homocitrate/citramalate synthase